MQTIAALFIIARIWKQPRCPLADEWIRKLLYIYTIEYYSAINKNAFESVLMRWMNLEPIIQSEVRKRKINVYIWNLEKTVLMNLFAEQQWRHRQKTDLWTQLVEQEGEGGMYGESNMETYITICKIDSQWEFAV